MSTPAAGEALRDDVRRGFLWLGTASAVARVIEVCKVFVVLWCLSSEQLGEATLAYSVCVVLEALNGLGLGQALLQAREVSARTLASAFWYTMAVATLLVLGMWLAAGPLARAYGQPSLAPMIMVAATKLWFVGAALVPLTLLNRALAFERIAVSSTLATLSSGLVTCGLAVAGCGAWSPLLGNTAGGLASMLFVWLAHPYKPRAQFDWPSLKPHASFGLKLAGSSALNQLYRNVDYLLLGQWLDVKAVGLYRVAFDLAMTPLLAVLQVVNRAAVPVYAKLSHDRAELRRTFLWTLQSLGLSLAPVCAVIALHAAPLLALTKGGEWASAAELVPYLCVAGLFRCLNQCFPSLFLALRKPWLVVLDSVLSGVTVSVLLGGMLALFATRSGSLAATWGWLLAYPLLTLALLAMTKPLLAVRLRDLVVSQRHTLGCLLSMGLARFMVHGLRTASPALDLLVSVAFSLLAYGAYAHFVAGTRFRRVARAAHTPPAELHRAPA